MFFFCIILLCIMKPQTCDSANTLHHVSCTLLYLMCSLGSSMPWLKAVILIRYHLKRYIVCLYLYTFYVSFIPFLTQKQKKM